MRVRAWFGTQRARREHNGRRALTRQQAIEQRWTKGLRGTSCQGQALPATAPANVGDLIAAGVTPDEWDKYSIVHSSGCLGASEFRLLDKVGDAWAPILGQPSSTARVVLLHSSGITPELLARWMAQQEVSWSGSKRTPTVLWTRMGEQLSDMVTAGVPLELVGLYVLAGYTTGEAMALSATAAGVTVESLRVQVELRLP